MKKYLFILGLVGTALFTACSTADDLVAEIPSQGLTDEEKALIVEAGQDSDVPITLGSVASSRAMTRTPIDPFLGTILFETPFDEDYPNPAAGKSQYLGVFCLAMGKQEGAPSVAVATDDIKWSTHQYVNWLNNVPAKVSKFDHTSGDDSPIAGGGADEDFSYIQFMKGDYTGTRFYYYPFGNWYYYDFFAYYPRQTSGIDVGYNVVDVDFTIDGSQDIIWAHAEGGSIVTDPVTDNDVKSYSAKYMRLSKEDLDEDGNPDHTDFEIVPGLDFKHKLTQLVFSVKPHDTDAAELHRKGFKLTGLSLKNVYENLQLRVAAKGDYAASAGTLEIKAGSTVTDIPARKATDDSSPFPIRVASKYQDENWVVDANEKEVGYVIVPSTSLISGKTYNQYLVNIQMQQQDENGKYPNEDGYSGSDVPDTVIILKEPTADVDGDGNPDGFAAGYKYNITLEIYNPTEIQATATLVGWADGYDDPDDGVIHVD